MILLQFQQCLQDLLLSFCATITIGIPTMNGFIVGLAGGAAITLSLLFRALVLQ